MYSSTERMRKCSLWTQLHSGLKCAFKTSMLGFRNKVILQKKEEVSLAIYTINSLEACHILLPEFLTKPKIRNFDSHSLLEIKVYYKLK